MPYATATCCPCGGRRINGKCDRCGPRKRRQHAKKTSARGYGWDWQKLVKRRKHDSDHVLCEDCQERGIVTVATERHHIVKIKHDPGKRLDDKNIRDLCGPCHKVRTAKGE